MPAVDTTVGTLPLPAPAGATDAALDDPTVTGIADYLAFWIKWALDAKLATMTTPPCKDPEDPAAVADACPVANVHVVDPVALLDRLDTSAGALPALFTWWDGKDSVGAWTTMRSYRKRDLQVLYVFDRVLGIDQLKQWAGLLSTVSATLGKAFFRRAHPTYAPTGFGAGTSIFQALGLLGATYKGGQPGFLLELAPEAARAAAGTGTRPGARASAIESGYPALRAVVEVMEEIGQDTLLDPGDVTRGINVHIRTNELGDTTNTLPVLDGILDSPDGSGIAFGADTPNPTPDGG